VCHTDICSQRKMYRPSEGPLSDVSIMICIDVAAQPLSPSTM